MIYVQDEDGNIIEILKPEPPKVEYDVSASDLEKVYENHAPIKEGDAVNIKWESEGIDINGVWKNGEFVAEEG